MINAQFSQLCRDTSLALQLEDPDDIVKNKGVRIDGIDIALHFDDNTAADRIFCYLDMGKVEEAKSEAMMRTLLRLNLLTGSKTNGVFALDPQSGNPIFVVHLTEPDRYDGARLAAVLTAYATQARATRDVLAELVQSEELA